MTDWNDWNAEIVKALNKHGISPTIFISDHWWHIRQEYKQGTPPEIVTQWLLERAAKYNVLEARVEDGVGKVIATDLSDYEANRMLERLYDEEKVWWKEKCYTNPKEHSDIA